MTRRTHLDDPVTGDFPDERVFSAEVDIRYVLQDPAESPPALVVAFSAAHAPDKPPRYYTHKALRKLGCPRLFVLDDQGPPAPMARPSWYLGRNGQLDVADSVLDLMDRTCEELGLPRERVITCGASKGGWAALYFGARFGAGHAIAGEPQVMLGRHLSQEENADVIRHVAGDSSQETVDFLDSMLFDAFRASPSPPRAHLYTGRTLYYERDVLPLVAFLEERGMPCELEVGDHTEHVPGLGLNFPGYLRPRLGALLQEMRRHDGSSGGAPRAAVGPSP